ncbi:hypothetical protein QUA00_03365 [Microcoleus sp. T2B6]
MRSAQDINSLAHLAQFFIQIFIVGWGPVYEIIDFKQFIVGKTRLCRFWENATRYQFFPHIASFLTTGKMPVPQRGNFLVRFVENATRYQFNRTLKLHHS